LQSEETALPENAIVSTESSEIEQEEIEQPVVLKPYLQPEDTSAKVHEESIERVKTVQKIPSEKELLKREVSGFSLSSIALKKAAKKINQPVVNEENPAEDSFEKEALLKTWGKYTEDLKKVGKQNIASIMEMRHPDLINQSTIEFRVANEMNKVEMIREIENLLPFLRKHLNHYGLKIELVVSDSIKKELIYSSQEKYTHLVKTNAALETLRQKFDLEY
jgi:DNA polymerase-3 subunit gamma/tau